MQVTFFSARPLHWCLFHDLSIIDTCFLQIILEAQCFLSPTSQFQATFLRLSRQEYGRGFFLFRCTTFDILVLDLDSVLAGSFVASIFYFFIGVFRLHVSDWYFCAVVVEKG